MKRLGFVITNDIIMVDGERFGHISRRGREDGLVIHVHDSTGHSLGAFHHNESSDTIHILWPSPCTIGGGLTNGIRYLLFEASRRGRPKHRPSNPYTTTKWYCRDTSWDGPVHDNQFGMTLAMVCPICACQYVHQRGRPRLSDQWCGRGTSCCIPFAGECGHRWLVHFGYHKGETFVFSSGDDRFCECKRCGQHFKHADTDEPAEICRSCTKVELANVEVKLASQHEALL